MVATILDFLSTKSINFLEGHILNISTMEQFYHKCGFVEEDFFFNLSNEKAYDSNVQFQNETKIMLNLENYLNNIFTKFV